MADIIEINEGNILPFLHSGIDIGRPFQHDIYLISVHIAGTTHIENIDNLEPELIIGKRVKFFREPENEHDERAIVIKNDHGDKLGYIPRDKNEILSRLMDAGKLLYGEVYDKELVGKWWKIMIRVFLDD